MIPFLVQEHLKKWKMLPLPLNFTNVWKKYRWSLKLMIFENDKSYWLEILIVYAQNKFVYAHGLNFFSTGIKFLKIFFINLRVPNFTRNFSFWERATKKQNERYAWKFNWLYPGYTHSYIWYQICVKLFNFLEFFFFIKVRNIPILSKIAYFRYRCDCAIIWPRPLSVNQSEFCFATN